MIAHSGILDHAALIGFGMAAIAARVTPPALARDHTIRPAAAWCAGVVTVLVALSPPMEAAADRSFTGHMWQHLLLILVAAPLLVVGGPRPARHRFGRHRFGRWRFGSVGVVAPVAAAVAFVTVIAVTHLTGLYDLALRQRVVHDAEHLAFVGAATLMWFAIGRMHRATGPGHAAAVFVVITGTALVSAILLTAPRPLVATYAEGLGADGLGDQRTAAAIMWVAGMATTLPLLVLAVWRWATAEQRRAERAEALREVPVVARADAVRS